ncbi:MAG: hypothetical protein RLZZ71_2026 [Bacteroidota bacterium]|jgi:hypothetical protein
MIKVLQTYIQQRFSSGLFATFAIWLFLYSVPFFDMNVMSALYVMKVFFILWCFRLYDDVMQWKHDAHLSDRIYTSKELRSKLILPLILSIGFIPLLTANDGPAFEIASAWFYFILVNHLLYKVFINTEYGAFLLPLLKYPVLFLYLVYSSAGEVDFNWAMLLSALALFCAMFFYDLLDNSSTSGRQSLWAYLIVVFSVVAVAVQNLALISVVFGAVILLASITITHLRIRGMAKVWLILFLMLKLIVNNYGI